MFIRDHRDQRIISVKARVKQHLLRGIRCVRRAPKHHARGQRGGEQDDKKEISREPERRAGN